MEFSKAAAELVDAYRQVQDAEPLVFTRSGAYRQFIEAAEQAGFTGPDVEMDPDYSDRSPGWVTQTDEEALRRWVNTLLRSDRWNCDYPNSVLMACRSGCLDALIGRLRG